MTPALERVQQHYGGHVALHKINADSAPEEVQALNVFGIPTLIVMRDGGEIVRRTGTQSEAALTALFEVATGAAPVAHGPTRTDRLLQLFAAALLFTIAWVNGPSLVLLLASGGVAFSAMYDRYPVWRSLRPRFSAMVRGER
jgi:thiol-disulfide isomerase/thioredoxin